MQQIATQRYRVFIYRIKFLQKMPLAVQPIYSVSSILRKYFRTPYYDRMKFIS
jgi:hypothetical protein